MFSVLPGILSVAHSTKSDTFPPVTTFIDLDGLISESAVHLGQLTTAENGSGRRRHDASVAVVVVAPSP